jgi:thiol-disulfide isomerase/thioredoxin
MAPLSLSRSVESLTASDFQRDRLSRPGTYLVDFSATWCPYCRRFLSRFAAREGTLRATLAVADISDVDNPLWDDFDLEVTPSMIAFREGAPIGRWNGRRWYGLDEGHLDQANELLGRVDRLP